MDLVCWTVVDNIDVRMLDVDDLIRRRSCWGRGGGLRIYRASCECACVDV